MNVFCSDCRREVAPGILGRCSTCDGILRPEYPDEVVAQWRGYLELQRAGLVDRLPRMIAVQSVDGSAAPRGIPEWQRTRTASALRKVTHIGHQRSLHGGTRLGGCARLEGCGRGDHR